MSLSRNGGITAPRGRGRGRPQGAGLPLQRAGNRQLPGRVNPPGVGMMNPPGQGPAQRGARGRGQGAPNGKGIGLGKAALPGPGGRQLAARVSSGAITQEQAERTMQQRQTLAKAFGPEWRKKISLGGQSFASVNRGLAKSPKDPTLAALRKKLLEGRKAALVAARAKNGGDEGEGEA